MQDYNFLYKSWKLIFASGALSLLLSTIIILFALKKLVPLFERIHQNRLRDQHDEPIPKIGGLGLMGSMFLTIVVLWNIPFDTEIPFFQTVNQSRFFGLIVGGFMAWSLGFVDDLFKISARWKLLGQFVLALFAIHTGFAIEQLKGPFFQEIDLGFMAWPITILWVVTIMNAINLIDGLDGLAGGIVITVLITLGVILWSSGSLPLLLVIMSLFGAVIGFLLFNRPPAITFMGDSGSQFLGYMTALLSIWATESADGKQSMLPLLILAIPLLDVFFAFTRRLLKGIPFYSADRDHIHHRLLAKGHSPSKSVLILVALSFLFSVLSLIAVYNSYLQGFSYTAGLLLCFFILYALEYDLLRKPMASIQGQNNLRKRRELMIMLADQIDDYFEKDHNSSLVIHSFNYWCKLVGIYEYKLVYGGKDYHYYGSDNDSLRFIIYKFKNWEIHLGLPRESWSIDSDVKGDLMEKVFNALVKRLELLESSKVLEPQKL
jgi:UDP-GlcNAc:undecaprenyl-phosphate GlcNAc-1-phosphate transferase